MQRANQDSPPDLPQDYCWLEGAQPYVVCAFYTPDYLPHALRLRRSLQRLDINCFLKRYERVANWETNTRIKPTFLAECLTRFEPRHVLYIDADALVHRPLVFLDGVTTDLAVWLQPVRKRGVWHVRIAPGTVYVRNTPGGRRFLEAWRYAEKDCGPLAKDGDLLHAAVGSLQGVTLTILPADYARVADAGQSLLAIEHLHVSRDRFKWRPALRKARRIAIAVGLIALASVAWYVVAGR